MALYRREHDRLGARIDMAMYDAMISMNERAIGMSAMLDTTSFRASRPSSDPRPPASSAPVTAS